MTDRVTQYLLEKGHITREQYDKARRTKEFFGGPLDAHLLKLGFIREDVLGSALTALTGCPYAGPGELRIVDPMVAARVPRELVEQHRICPFEKSDDILRIAMLNPRDAVAIARSESASGLIVEPWVTSEYRLNLALERHYRVRQRHYKALSLGPQTDTEKELSLAEESRSTLDAGTDQEQWDGGVGLDGRPLDAELTADQFSLLGNTALLSGENAEKTAERTTEKSARPPGADGLSALGRTLSSAGDIEEINAGLLDHCARKVARCALFALSGDGFKCTAGRGRSLASARTGEVSIPAGNGHLFDQVLEAGKSFYLGAVPPLPANRDLFSLLGGNLPPMAMILPIKVRSRVVALLYLDNDTDPIDNPDIPAMRRLAAKAGLAFEVFLLRRKLEDL